MTNCQCVAGDMKRPRAVLVTNRSEEKVKEGRKKRVVRMCSQQRGQKNQTAKDAPQDYQEDACRVCQGTGEFAHHYLFEAGYFAASARSAIIPEKKLGQVPNFRPGSQQWPNDIVTVPSARLGSLKNIELIWYYYCFNLTSWQRHTRFGAQCPFWPIILWDIVK